jgi:hypothetical protein
LEFDKVGKEFSLDFYFISNKVKSKAQHALRNIWEYVRIPSTSCLGSGGVDTRDDFTGPDFDGIDVPDER